MAGLDIGDLGDVDQTVTLEEWRRQNGDTRQNGSAATGTVGDVELEHGDWRLVVHARG